MSSNNPGPNSEEIKYKGVRKRKWGKWVSEIRLPHSRERIWLGSYDSPEKAARAFDAAQFCLRGRAANFNFPDNPPEIEGGQGLSPAEIQIAAARFANAAEEEQPRPPTESAAMVEEDVQWENQDLCFDDGGAGPFYSYTNNYDLNQLDRMGSGFNYEAEFGLVPPGLGDFYGSQQPDNTDFGFDNWNNGSGSQSSFLWNF
ncbi:hypothetical protein V2J09_002482 [Rumex salicifolius]